MLKLFARIWQFCGVVLLAYLTVRLISADVRFAALPVLVIAVVFGIAGLKVRLNRRNYMRRLLLSGDITRILASWQASLARAGTMGPLMSATAFAAYGFIDQAHAALSKARRSPSWDAALEQRLFVEALLDVYEGERSRAVAKAAALEQLPLPDASFWMRRKVALLRRGVAALARAFAHASRAEDEAVLRKAGRSSPLVHWAMRYAEAVFLVDAGRAGEARLLLDGAPSWPEESAFRSFHDELTAQLAG